MWSTVRAAYASAEVRVSAVLAHEESDEPPDRPDNTRQTDRQAGQEGGRITWVERMRSSADLEAIASP